MKTDYDYIANDFEFKELGDFLDKCSKEHGICEKCCSFKNCQKAFDQLADIRDVKMTVRDRARFESKLFNKQTSF
jgi:hypothetical protein